MSPALTRGLKKGLRSLVQLAAGGALTTLVANLAGGLSPTIAGLVLAAWTAIVAAAQNTLESAGTIPTLLPTTPPVPAPAPVPVGVADSPTPGPAASSPPAP